MDTASVRFIFFGLAVALASNISVSRHWRSFVLLVGSLIFLILLNPRPALYVGLAGFVALGYILLATIERGFYRLRLVAVAITIFAFIWLKKYAFLPEITFLSYPYLTVGISYIFFRVLHLLIEADAEAAKHNVGIVSYALYTLNFTTFISGPIQRYDEFAEDQFAHEPIELSAGIVGIQLERIVRGFFKVNVIALLLSIIQTDSLATLSQPVSFDVKFAAAFKLAVVYPFFLYNNFSGYIDIVIALARLLRVRLPENFDRPFSASSFLDFWARWHITLSTWLKTYVYNALLMALMRRVASIKWQPALGVASFFVTFFIVGIWHGRTSEFAFFGLLQGGGVAINKTWQIWLAQRLGRKGYKSLSSNHAYVALSRGLTFTWFAFTLFWFWANWIQIKSITTALGVGNWLLVFLVVWLSASLFLDAWEWLRSSLLSIRIAESPLITSRYARIVSTTVMVLAALVITVLLDQAAPDIIYKAF